MSQYTAISLANLVAGTTARVETSRSSRLNDLLGELMFHGAIATRQRSKSGYLDYLDQSWRLEFPEAILMGEVAETEGAAAELNESASAPSRLMPFRPELSGRLRQNTTVRFFLPVPKEQS